MAKPVTDFSWATDANFSSGPAVGNPTKVNPPGWTAVVQGLVPGNAVVAEHLNQVLNLIGDYTDWVQDGATTGALDAHIVETDVIGNTNVRAIGYTRRIDNDMQRIVITTLDVEIRASAQPNQGSEFLVDISGLTANRVLTVNVDAGNLPSDGEQLWLIINSFHASNILDVDSEGGGSNPIFTTTTSTPTAVRLIFDDTLGANGEFIVAAVVPLS